MAEGVRKSARVRTREGVGARLPLRAGRNRLLVYRKILSSLFDRNEMVIVGWKCVG